MRHLHLIQGGAGRAELPRQKPAYVLFTFEDRSVIRLQRPGACPADLVFSRQEAVDFCAALLLMLPASSDRRGGAS